MPAHIFGKCALYYMLHTAIDRPRPALNAALLFDISIPHRVSPFASLLYNSIPYWINHVADIV